MPTTIEGLEVQTKIIGSGSHSKVILGSYFLTPVAIKEFFDSDAFAREFDFYNRAKKLCSHPNLLSVIGAYTNSENNKNCIVTELC